MFLTFFPHSGFGLVKEGEVIHTSPLSRIIGGGKKKNKGDTPPRYNIVLILVRSARSKGRRRFWDRAI